MKSSLTKPGSNKLSQPSVFVRRNTKSKTQVNSPLSKPVFNPSKNQMVQKDLKIDTNIKRSDINNSILCAPSPLSSPLRAEFTADQKETMKQLENKNNADPILSAKASLLELRLEAKTYLDSNKKLFSRANHSKRYSLKPEDSTSFSFMTTSRINSPNADVVKELIKNVNTLNQRLIQNEKVNEIQQKHDSFLKEKIENLETKIEDQKSLILDSKSTNIGCSTQCIVF